MPRHGMSFNINVLQQINDKQINDKEEVGHIFNRIVLSHVKNEIMPLVATWVELEVIRVNQGNQLEKYIYHIKLPICGI